MVGANDVCNYKHVISTDEQGTVRKWITVARALAFHPPSRTNSKHFLSTETNQSVSTSTCFMGCVRHCVKRARLVDVSGVCLFVWWYDIHSVHQGV